MVVGSQPKIKKITVDHPQFFIGGSRVENVDRAKYLGVWGCCGVTKLQTFQKLQNRAARIVTKSNFDTPSIGLIQSLKWPTVCDIIRGETATTVYKSLNGLVPEYLSSFFEKRSTRNVRELRNTETDLSIPLRKTNNGQRAISFRGPKLWNSLELDVKQAPSLATFKGRIKS